jgi:hypothetical protein
MSATTSPAGPAGAFAPASASARVREMLERVSAEVTTQARQVRVLPVVLGVVAGLLYAVGWVTAKVVTVAWFVVVWACVAVAVGWREARAPTRAGPPGSRSG